ncbi:hypothetical protein B0O80DRAFT_534103 [Mortierella sp. GBAus27b]|nr:hypothetical protein BGX31_003851 [Mortierella sp. GBA43]KAI8345777.1 hypothetical protein B0O80DRAFT_534103 [Mortierella sp. GBAus27b]
MLEMLAVVTDKCCTNQVPSAFQGFNVHGGVEYRDSACIPYSRVYETRPRDTNATINMLSSAASVLVNGQSSRTPGAFDSRMCLPTTPNPLALDNQPTESRTFLRVQSRLPPELTSK